jgi:muramidase (phage lysozyme)
MSGTVIDSLIMQLKLDGSDFRKGADDAVKANKDITDSATTTATQLESKGKIAASFWTDQKIGILGVLGVVIAGGKALEDITVKAGAAAAATGRAAQIGNTTPQRLSGLQAIAKEYGSTADAATSAISSILKAERDYKLSGAVDAPLGAIRQLPGVTPFDAQSNPIDTVVQMEQIAAALKKLPEQQALAFGGRLGFSDDYTNALIHTPANDQAGFEKLIQQQATTTDAQAATGEKFVTASGQLSDALTKFDHVVMNQIAPFLIPAIKDLTAVIEWLDKNPKAAAAAGIGGAVVGGAAGVSLLKRAAAFFLGKGAAGAGEAAELGAAAETAGIAGSVALNPLTMAALATFAATGPAGPADEGAQLRKLFPNAPRGTAATADATLPPIAQNFLNTVGQGESGNDYSRGYGNNPGFADHPRVETQLPNGQETSAAGRYQFEAGTWDRIKSELGLNDFSPANQDKAAWQLAQEDYRSRTGRDLLTDLRAHDPATNAGIKQALAATWPSIVNDNLNAPMPQSGDSRQPYSTPPASGLSPATDALIAQLRSAPPPVTAGGHQSAIYKALVAAGGSYNSVINGMRAQGGATTNHHTPITATINVNGAKNPAATAKAVKASLNTLGIQAARGLS